MASRRRRSPHRDGCRLDRWLRLTSPVPTALGQHRGLAHDHLAALEAYGICVAVRQPLRFFASGAHRSKLRPSPTAKYTAANIPVCSKVA
jgi:hypothetical protein